MAIDFPAVKKASGRSFCVGVFEPKFSQKTLEENCLQIWGRTSKRISHAKLALQY